MRVLICPDKFAGTLSAPAVAEAVATGLSGPDELTRRPLSDGGPGFVEVLAGALGGRLARKLEGVAGDVGELDDLVALVVVAEHE